MDILSMFNDIKIKNTNRLTNEDLEFCELQEKIYNKIYNVYEQLIHAIDEVKNNDVKELNEKFNHTCGNYTHYYTNAITYEHRIGDLKNNINKLSGNMISGMTSYFSHKYNIELDYEKIKNLAEDKKIDYNFIVDLIFEQLGGFSFEDKAKQQIIDKLKDETKQYREDTKKVQVKNNKVIIADFLWRDSWDKNQLSYQSYHKLEILFNAINMFFNNEQSEEYIRELYDIKYFGEYELKFSGCTSTKFYKNGKVDLIFSDGIKALEFANEYTNYAIN
ncbi:hypothetical protein DVV91_09885 [Clostridium botulinum]|uniref:hypothetical protein n=1 Tax=Clostridium botulinum TaxID=1491 RepID=UPI0019685114|nr:hypothetical protein [Clostridium botulinum]MBN1074650.1 hypothetical protein [Clostridium botulinum]